jgi:hypothetical protein
VQEGKSGLEDPSGCGVTEPLSTASPSPTASAKSSKNGASNGKPKTVDEAIALYAEEQAFHSDKAGRLTTRSTPPRPAARYSSSETIRQERRAAAYDHRRILLGSTGISGRAGRLGAGRIYPQQTRYDIRQMIDPIIEAPKFDKAYYVRLMKLREEHGPYALNDDEEAYVKSYEEHVRMQRPQ